jgi:hypothetical protein
MKEVAKEEPKVRTAALKRQTQIQAKRAKKRIKKASTAHDDEKVLRMLDC